VASYEDDGVVVEKPSAVVRGAMIYQYWSIDSLERHLKLIQEELERRKYPAHGLSLSDHGTAVNDAPSPVIIDFTKVDFG
jgi:hypothetical protein